MLISRITRTFLILTSFVVLLSFCIYGITFSPGYQQCVTNKHSNQTDKEKDNTSKNITIFLSCEVIPLDRHAGTLAAFGTFAIAFFTLTLWIVTNNTLRLAREEFLATHRPRIVLRTIHIEQPNVRYELTNVGNSSGAVIESRITIERSVMSQYPDPFRTNGINELGRLNISAGETVDQTMLNGGFSLITTIPNTENVSEEGGHSSRDFDFYFSGAIVYADGRGVRRRSVFRRRWDRQGQRFVRLDDPDQEYAD